jgi:hypothetical protein
MIHSAEAGRAEAKKCQESSASMTVSPHARGAGRVGVIGAYQTLPTLTGATSTLNRAALACCHQRIHERIEQ